MNYTPLTWYEQEYLRYKAHFETLPRAPCSLRPVWFHHKATACRSYRPVHQFIKLTAQCFQVHRVHLATAYVGLKKCIIDFKLSPFSVCCMLPSG